MEHFIAQNRVENSIAKELCINVMAQIQILIIIIINVIKYVMDNMLFLLSIELLLCQNTNKTTINNLFWISVIRQKKQHDLCPKTCQKWPVDIKKG